MAPRAFVRLAFGVGDELILEGRQCSLNELATTLSRLPQKSLVLILVNEASAYHPLVGHVLGVINNCGLHVRSAERPDFSDLVDEDGVLRDTAG
jgi:hypothetical protein